MEIHTHKRDNVIGDRETGKSTRQMIEPRWRQKIDRTGNRTEWENDRFGEAWDRNKGYVCALNCQKSLPANNAFRQNSGITHTHIGAGWNAARLGMQLSMLLLFVIANGIVWSSIRTLCKRCVVAWTWHRKSPDVPLLERNREAPIQCSVT